MAENSPFAFVDRASFVHPPKAITAFVDQLTAGRNPRRERHSEPRFTIAVVVEVQPVDDDFKPAGEAFQAVTRDISPSGIGITHNQSVESKFLALRLTNPEGEQLQTAVEVLRCQQVGSMYDIGGKFVTEH